MRDTQLDEAMTSGIATDRPRGRRWLVIVLLALIVALSACTDEGRDRVGDALETVTTAQPADGEGAAPAEPAPEEPAPEETEPPEREEPAPAAEAESAAPATEDEGLSTEDWILLIVLGLAALAIIMGAMTAASRRAEARASAQAALRSRLSEVVGQSRWIHDSGSIEVLLATDADQLTRVWNEVRTRMIGLESQISTLAAGTGNENLDRDLRYLAQCVSDLRAAEEGYVTTRLRAGGDHSELTRTSNQTVTDRRQQLQVAIEPVAAAMRI